MALRVTTNIDLLIKDFFHNPPSYKVVITLSWKATEPRVPEQTGAAKRTLSASATGNAASTDSNNKKKTERGVYAPPSGRYSVNSSPYSPGQQQQQGKRRTYSNGANQQPYRPNRY